MFSFPPLQSFLQHSLLCSSHHLPMSTFAWSPLPLCPIQPLLSSQRDGLRQESDLSPSYLETLSDSRLPGHFRPPITIIVSFFVLGDSAQPHAVSSTWNSFPILCPAEEGPHLFLQRLPKSPGHNETSISLFVVVFLIMSCLQDCFYYYLTVTHLAFSRTVSIWNILTYGPHQPQNSTNLGVSKLPLSDGPLNLERPHFVTHWFVQQTCIKGLLCTKHRVNCWLQRWKAHLQPLQGSFKLWEGGRSGGRSPEKGHPIILAVREDIDSRWGRMDRGESGMVKANSIGTEHELPRHQGTQLNHIKISWFKKRKWITREKYDREILKYFQVTQAGKLLRPVEGKTIATPRCPSPNPWNLWLSPYTAKGTLQVWLS